MASEQYQIQGISGESANVDKEAAYDWKRHLAAVGEGYAIEDQFNADETAMFYRQLPMKSLVFKGELCKGGKFAKERLSIMCCSATGEKLKPLVIGNATRPHAFKQNSITPDNLLVTWKHNKKMWMTTAVFEDWLNQLNETMKKKREGPFSLLTMPPAMLFRRNCAMFMSSSCLHI